ncbi:MAG: redoxin domain-containing protein [Desulfohalobiaceae bacterium]
MRTKAQSTFWALGLALFFAFLALLPPMAQATEVQEIDPDGVEKLINSDQCPIIISIVTSRCSACRKEMPVYQEMYEQYKDQGLAVFVISVDFGYPSAIQSIVDRLDLSYPVFWGGEEVMQAYDISMVPYKMIIQDGAVQTSTGAWSESELEEKINQLLQDCPE